MRLIKGYNDFITEEKSVDKFGITPELESDVKDIFVELRDEGIEVDTQRWISQSDMICITLSPIDVEGDRHCFKVGSVKEYVMMLIDYMKIKYDVKKVSYDVCLGDFTTNWGDTITNSYDEFPDKVGDLDTNEFGINFEVPDYEINEGFGDFIGPEYNMSSDYTNTRQSKFNPYSFDNEVTIYLIERA